MITNLLYVYCISNNPLMVPSEIVSRGLKSLIFNDFNVLYKLVSESDYTENNFLDIKWLETNSRKHMGVIIAAMEFGAVIPFKFGTIFNSKTSLKKFITDYSDSLVKNFKYIKEKEEYAVKIYCDRKVLLGRMGELSKEIESLDKTIAASSPGKAYLLKSKKTALLEDEMDKICSEYGQKYYNEFSHMSVSSNTANLLMKESSGRTDTMILNATFLVSNRSSDDFIKKANDFANEDIHIGFCVETTGPWPPFNFISIKEK
ncbi:hypothetical protein BST83_10310 [Polaribacter filamentus]|uniref:Gas vesicle protein GvpFL n=1 Tax=Polaribacter filamentus TaxID=53483 RepID=A0A2S7KXX1_9FLAO|nr:GvpL/GvpF family gas vesicle protein [Polaribacter filamentus]PQB07509.1 hypothetical protein BST83_10310 [Polaribacter filamentus]